MSSHYMLKTATHITNYKKYCTFIIHLYYLNFSEKDKLNPNNTKSVNVGIEDKSLVSLYDSLEYECLGQLY